MPNKSIENNDNRQVQDDLNKTGAEPEKKVVSDVIEDKEAGVNNKPANKDDVRLNIANNFDKKHRNFSGANTGDDDLEDDLEEEEDDQLDNPSDPDMVTVKINGRERQVEKSKVDDVGGVANYQKIVAANESLREVAENRQILDEHAALLRQKEDELKQREAALSKGRVTNPGSDDEPDDDLPLDGDQQKELTAKAANYREKLFKGTEEEADEALAQLLIAAKGNASTAINEVEEISESAATKALQKIEQIRYKNELTRAVQKFNTDYEDIVSDERLWGMADAETTVIKREHPNWTPDQILTEAGERIREWRDGSGEGNSTNTGQGNDLDTSIDKKAEKRQLTNAKPGSNRRPGEQQSGKVESNQDYIKRLRQSRGLE